MENPCVAPVAAIHPELQLEGGREGVRGIVTARADDPAPEGLRPHHPGAAVRPSAVGRERRADGPFDPRHHRRAGELVAHGRGEVR